MVPAEWPHMVLLEKRFPSCILANGEASSVASVGSHAKTLSCIIWLMIFAILWDRLCGHILRIQGLNFDTDFDSHYLSTKVSFLALPMEGLRDECEEGPDMSYKQLNPKMA